MLLSGPEGGAWGSGKPRRPLSQKLERLPLVAKWPYTAWVLRRTMRSGGPHGAGQQGFEGLPPETVGDDGGLRGENQRMGPEDSPVPALGTPVEGWAWWGKEHKHSSAVVTPW
jgi:hypothetical protein